MKPVYNKEEKEDMSIRTRKATFMEPAHTPPPTIPGMVSLGKSGTRADKKARPEQQKNPPKQENQAKRAENQPKADKRKNKKPQEAAKPENPVAPEKKAKAQRQGKADNAARNEKKAKTQEVRKPEKRQKQGADKQHAENHPVTLPMPKEAARPVAIDPIALAETVTDAVVQKRGSGKKARKTQPKEAAHPVAADPIALAETVTDAVVQKHGAGKKARKTQPKKPDMGRVIRCTFQYSGKGFGFGVPVEGETFPEDIFLPPDETCGAMTGDTVNVELQGRDERGPAGIVRGIVAHNVYTITGTVALDSYGEPVVVPDGDRYKVTVSIPRKDMENLSAPVGTKVAVEPVGDPYFVREDLSRKRPRDHRQQRGKRRESDVRSPEVRGRIAAVFGSADTKAANYAAILHEAGIPTEFPAYVLRAAEESSREVLTPVGRRDLRGRVIFTIDGAGAKDLDDAISLTVTDEGYILGVHIADVSHYVPYGGCVEKEARERGTSVYFVDKVVPMLPESLSNGACSLNAGEDKYALTCEIALDRDGNRMGGAVYRSIIRSTVRGVYSEVNALLDGTAEEPVREKYAAVLPVLREMHKLYGQLRKNAAARGVIELSDVEAEIVLGDDGMPVDIRRRERGDAEKMIEQFMLAANMTVAELLHGHALPCLYRIHETPEAEKIASFGIFAHNLGLNAGDIVPEAVRDPDKLAKRLQRVMLEADERGLGDTVSAVLLRSMMKAKYVAECAPHFGLGAAEYCHFTSPIRRYPDLFVHTVLNAVLPYTPDGILANGTELPRAAVPEMLASSAAERGAWATECEIRAQSAEWKIEDLYVALYMRSHIGEEFDAVVSGVMQFGVFVRCENLAEGLVPAFSMDDVMINEAAYTFRYRGIQRTLGSPMRVRLEDADVSAGKLTFAVV